MEPHGPRHRRSHAATGSGNAETRRRGNGGAAQREAEALSVVIGAAYDAALDPGLWPAAVSEACRFLDCAYGALGAADLLRNDVNFIVQWGYSDETWDAYLTRYHHMNPFNAPAFRTRIGDVVVGSRHETYPSFLASDFYRDFAAPLGIVDAVQATIDRSASGLALLNCVRHRDAGVATDTQLRRMRLIAPHFRRAILVGGIIDRHAVQAAAFVEAIDRLVAGVFLVNPHGVMIHANRSGEKMIAAGDPVSTGKGGELAAVDAAASQMLKRAFSAAGAGDIAIGSTGMAVPLAGLDGRTFVANVLPLEAGARREAAQHHSAASALFVRETRVDLDTAIGAAAQLYGLTAAEMRVVRAVVEVGGIPAVAAFLGTSRGTVKSQLDAIFRKTATRRQAELVGLITGYASRV
jgi:DNA-binding CsgD family transcriptional regulator